MPEKLEISQHSLQTLFEIAMKADEAGLIGSCQQSNDPHCSECSAMAEAQQLLIAE
jgi:hypothetical protein